MNRNSLIYIESCSLLNESPQTQIRLIAFCKSIHEKLKEKSIEVKFIVQLEKLLDETVLLGNFNELAHQKIDKFTARELYQQFKDEILRFWLLDDIPNLDTMTVVKDKFSNNVYHKVF
jgi:hypothetical protein